MGGKRGLVDRKRLVPLLPPREYCVEVIVGVLHVPSGRTS